MRSKADPTLALGIALLLLGAAPATAEVLIFSEGFESGSDCAWSSATQDVAQPPLGSSFEAITIDGSDSISSSCNLPGGREKVYAYVVPATGTLSFDLAPVDSWDVSIYLRTGCSAATELICVENNGSELGEQGQVAVTAGQKLFLFIDGYSVGDAGDFIFDSALCGDGIVGFNEMCDGLDLNGSSCETFGFLGGSLACTSTCTYDVSNCIS